MKSYRQNIVIDLEFTQVDQKYKRRTFRQEIIQIGSVRVSPSGEVLDSFLPMCDQNIQAACPLRFAI